MSRMAALFFEHSFGLPWVGQLQVPKPCSDQCSDQCPDVQMSADAPINVCRCVCICVVVGGCIGWLRVCVALSQRAGRCGSCLHICV